MKKLLMVVAAAIMLAGCDPSTKDVSGSFEIPKELKDKGCVMYRMENEYAKALYVLYCPNASTTTQTQEKHPINTSTIVEGEYYGEYR